MSQRRSHRACKQRRLWAMLAAAVALTAAAPTEAGWIAWDAGDYSRAVDIWRQSAPSGKRVAQYGLAVAYDFGRGVPQDSAEACKWYALAARSNYARAAFRTAAMHEDGRCGKQDPAEAAIWYARAAADGMGQAQFTLAQLYEAGNGVPRNPEMAAAWFKAAAANGVDAAAAWIAKPKPGSPKTPGPLIPVTLMSPQKNRPVPASEDPMPLVWTAPPEPEPVKFYIELKSLDSGDPIEILSQYVEVSAALAQLPQENRRYAWRVFTVGLETQRYVATPWDEFAVTTEPS